MTFKTTDDKKVSIVDNPEDLIEEEVNYMELIKEKTYLHLVELI